MESQKSAASIWAVRSVIAAIVAICMELILMIIADRPAFGRIVWAFLFPLDYPRLSAYPAAILIATIGLLVLALWLVKQRRQLSAAILMLVTFLLSEVAWLRVGDMAVSFPDRLWNVPSSFGEMLDKGVFGQNLANGGETEVFLMAMLIMQVFSSLMMLVAGLILLISRGRAEKSEGQLSDSGLRVCPFCAEEVKIEAKKCKHCGEFLEEPHA